MKYNFAYGSNLHPKRVLGRADVEPARCEPAVLRDHRLAFNLATGLTWVEPAMANVVEAPGESVHGVALGMTEEELASLVGSEGGDMFYRSVEVEVETYRGERIRALMFIAREEMLRNEVPPSARYIRLLREGARHHGLDEAYCRFLENHPCEPPSALSRSVMRTFRLLEAKPARPLRDVVLRLLKTVARAEARRSRRR